jgi:hypothetical protein
MMDLLFVGIGWTDLAITLNRIAVGAFFMLSGNRLRGPRQRLRLSVINGCRPRERLRSGGKRYGAGVIDYGVRVSAYGFSHRRTYRPRQRLMIDHGIGVIAHRIGMIDHGQQ